MKKALFFLAALSLAAFLFLYYSQDSDMKARVKLGNASTMENISITQTKAGAKNFTMKAERAVFVSDTDVELTTVAMHFPEKGMTVTSDTGAFNVETKNLSIQGNVKARTDDYDIVTNTLSWDAAKNSITTGDKVTIVGRRFTVEGEQLSAIGESATLNRNVRAVFTGK